MSISSLSFLAQRVFVPTILLAALFMILSVLFGTSRLPLGIWTLEGYDVFYNAVVIIQVPLVVFVGFVTSCFDCLYFAFCTEIIIQFKILCYHLEHLTASDNDLKEMETNHYKKMSLCIRQHDFLIR